VDLDVGLVVDVLGLAAEARAGVDDALEGEAELHLLIELSAVHDADRVGVLCAKTRALASLRINQRSRFIHFSLD